MDLLKGKSKIPDTTGLAIKVKNTITIIAGIKTEGRLTGVTKRPNKKKIITCAISVITSKNAPDISFGKLSVSKQNTA